MKVRQLEAFQAVVTSGSVTRAAARMNVSQSAVSQLLGHLERTCGFKLFDRRGGKILLTREAEALYSEVQRMFINVDRIARVAVAIREQSWGSLRIAAFPAMSRCIVPQIILDFQKDHSETRFHTQSMRSRSVIDAVAAQHIDIGISSMPGDRPEVESTLITTMEAVCLLPASHRLIERPTIHARDLAGENFISLGLQDGSKTIVDRVFDQLNIHRSILIECGQSETIYSFVAENAGISVVDPLCVYNQGRTGDPRIQIRSFSPKVDFGIWLIRAKSSTEYGLIDSFEKRLKTTIFQKLTALNEQLNGT